MYPHEARLRNLTYSSSLFVKVSYTRRSEEEVDATVVDESLVQIGQIPVMLRSRNCNLFNKTDQELAHFKECPFDQGGYFIMKGGEKVLIAQESAAMNTVIALKHLEPKVTYTAACRSYLENSNTQPSPINVTITGGRGAHAKTACDITAKVPQVTAHVNVVIYFRALGVERDKDIVDHIVYDRDDETAMEYLRPSLESTYEVNTQKLALDYIGKRAPQVGGSRDKRIAFAQDVMQKRFLPHVGVGEDKKTRKAYFFGYMIHKALGVMLDRVAPTDRDHFCNKRLNLSGPLLAQLFTLLFANLITKTRKDFERKVNDDEVIEVRKLFDQSIITNGLGFSLSTGNWGVRGNKNSQSTPGVSQPLSRLTFAASLSHLRRVSSPIGKEGKNSKIRQLHNTHWGMVCPAETPEGHQCGLIKNLALMTYITVGTGSKALHEFLSANGNVDALENINPTEIHGVTKVFVNGAWVAVTRDASAVSAWLMSLRRSAAISSEHSIVRDFMGREIRVNSDAGRTCRPLFIVDNQRVLARKEHSVAVTQKAMKWADFVRRGLVEFIDTEEEETVLIAMNLTDVRGPRATAYAPAYTHCEIHPSLILGVCASIIPFPDHNQSPRNTYQSAMGKQAMGVYATNYLYRMDTTAHVLYYPQKPLVTTRAMEHLKFRELPAGINCVVAIACYSGYNQEDSVILSQAAVDRGLFRSTHYKLFSDVAQSKVVGGGADLIETFEKPGEGVVEKRDEPKYAALDSDGFVPPGVMVTAANAVIGKTVPDVSGGPNGERGVRDASVMYKGNGGVVDMVMLTTNQDGCPLVKSRVRTVRVPQIGDKFSSRHGQKGTCGMTYRQEDMPFTVEGIVPDIIVNPHAIPSRMTIGQLVECLLCKLSCLKGVEGDATPFTDVTVEEISAELHKNGYQRRGLEILYNGHTGRRLEAKVFIGPTYYQRLKHLVDDKINSRSRGKITSLVRQPVEGRARGGGLRFGEMERDCIVAHGTAQFLRERLFEQSDKYSCYFCDLCGLIATADESARSFNCKVCKQGVSISRLELPYSMKLLMQELMCMSIAPRVHTAATPQDRLPAHLQQQG
jgi:DNA-directed RNA polymerase II subunit RPB2